MRALTALLLALLLVAPTRAQGTTPSPEPTPLPSTSIPTSTEPTATGTPPALPTQTATAIPAVNLDASSVLTTSQQLVTSQLEAWTPPSPLAPLFLSLAGLLFVFGILLLIRRGFSWRN